MRTFLMLLLVLSACKKQGPITYTPAEEPEPEPVATPEPEPEPEPEPAGPYPSARWLEVTRSAPGDRAAGVGDLDGDGRCDLVIASPGAGQVQIAFGSGLDGLADGAGLRFDRTLTGGGSFGASFVGPGDVDGDGTDDLYIGAPDTDMDGPRRGAVYLFKGTTLRDNPDPILDDAWTVATGAKHDAVGLSLSALGDLDGDGLADVLIPGRVRAYVGFGRSLPNYESLFLRDAEGLLTGPAESEEFRPEASPLGDVLGDGQGEALVVAPKFGGAWILAGRSFYDDTIFDLTDAHLIFTAPGPHLGALAAAPDLTGDGRGDPVVAWQQGGRLVLSVVDAGTLVTGGELDVSTQALTIIRPPSSHAIASVADAGDVDGDGLDDLWIGGRMETGTRQARAWLVLGASLAGADTFSLDQADAIFDYELDPAFWWTARATSAGDLDNDGHADLVVTLHGRAWDDYDRQAPTKVFVHLGPYRVQ